MPYQMEPRVSVVIPMRNEQRFIERCLEALVTQDYPTDYLEVLIVDGMSTDRSAELAGRFVSICSNFQLLRNPQKITPAAFNIGIRHAGGNIIAIVSAHAVLAPNYLSCCVSALKATGADNVGGPMNAVSDTYMGKAIALATSSPFGVGSARFHYADKPMWVDTVYMGAYRREVFDRIGLFDEELVRNQDDELNFRLLRAGGKIWLDPEIRSTYYSRSGLRGLWKQYFEYGFWKVRVIQKHGRPASLRHLVPALFVLALILSALVSVATLSPWWSIAVLVPYLSAAIATAVTIAARNGWQVLPVLPFAFATMHLAYGGGFIVGLVHFGLRRRPANRSDVRWTN